MGPESDDSDRVAMAVQAEQLRTIGRDIAEIKELLKRQNSRIGDAERQVRANGGRVLTLETNKKHKCEKGMPRL